jgi:hypothetical protein
MIDAQFRFNQCNSFREEYISVFSPYGPVLILWWQPSWIKLLTESCKIKVHLKDEILCYLNSTMTYPSFSFHDKIFILLDIRASTN